MPYLEVFVATPTLLESFVRSEWSGRDKGGGRERLSWNNQVSFLFPHDAGLLCVGSDKRVAHSGRDRLLSLGGWWSRLAYFVVVALGWRCINPADSPADAELKRCWVESLERCLEVVRVHRSSQRILQPAAQHRLKTNFTFIFTFYVIGWLQNTFSKIKDKEHLALEQKYINKTKTTNTKNYLVSVSKIVLHKNAWLRLKQLTEDFCQPVLSWKREKREIMQMEITELVLIYHAMNWFGAYSVRPRC